MRGREELTRRHSKIIFTEVSFDWRIVWWSVLTKSALIIICPMYVLQGRKRPLPLISVSTLASILLKAQFSLPKEVVLGEEIFKSNSQAVDCGPPRNQG